MSYTVRLTRQANKQKEKLPEKVKTALLFLLHEISRSGPVRGDWPNYGKLSYQRHHRHIKKGKPTYVAVWEEIGGEINLVELTYVGTHEKAPY
ncbi:cytotoxic translational repressor of toxin-antitoxin stability system [Geomonas terrae]|uniref:Cytotoxic translational repressor of toxin-antitoxin stability system n=1 Tax=Geomonas terrae TaxID=2562681 RepID=A0A4S1CCI4_9BACT|nr:cytotoxic translational repressor of toxin-antitoxin stability system [Geomonas terrae]TGU71071.1 cytotoxic translational repressor of toxin-antitoxin stability system [Geomonas terrae]